jgi:hypothetical protein
MRQIKIDEGLEDSRCHSWIPVPDGGPVCQLLFPFGYGVLTRASVDMKFEALARWRVNR